MAVSLWRIHSPAFAESVESTSFASLHRLSVGCCSHGFDASVAAENGDCTLLPHGTRTISVDFI
jgi:hypothetical protein